MKKLYSLLLISLPLLSFAQPTVQQSDEPVINLYWATAVDPNYTGAIPAGGNNVTWDYTTLQFVDTGGAHFLDVEGTPFQTTFPNANICTHDSVKDEWTYFHTSASGIYVSGIDSAGITLAFNPEWMYLPVPFTYLNTRSATGRMQIDTSYNGTPARIVRTVKDDFTADGWGTLKIPGNTIANTLRIDDKQMSYDTVYVDTFSIWLPVYTAVSQVHNFRWVRDNGPDAFLLEIRADSLGTTGTRSEYELINFISVPEIAKQTLHVTSYPNPTRDVINIAFEKSVSGNIAVYNSLNELVRTSSFTDINQYRMYVNTLAGGLYHFVVTTYDNKIREGSFVVSH